MIVDTGGEYRAALNRMKMRLMAQEKPTANGARPRVTVNDIDEALNRLDKGTYGICSACFLVIPKGELLMRPYTEVCGPCRVRLTRAA